MKIDEFRKVKSEELSKSLADRVDEGRLTSVQAQALQDALIQERELLKSLRGSSEILGERAADVLMRGRGEISLFGNEARPGAGHLDRVGVTLDPPSITVYEAKGGSGRLGSAQVNGVPHQQGTGPYLEKLMTRNPRFVQALADLIESKGDEAAGLAQALREGKIGLNYDLVQAHPDGDIGLSRFVMDPAPKLPEIPHDC
ncbi:hypothetical protein [Arachnia propionica]|uniref:Uncharacterized protein n=1 Tax=Arachnia propionica TaxID=1750 RepID=A0A3P1WW64_9ACTN|nr:hypothetical protein [Arachnia propionica]RRD50894.1 hypothetical protein EII35_02260 [Arachnia propionica]